MEETQEIAIQQMKAAVQKFSSSTEAEGNLKRFLVARSMDPEKAARMFVQWKKWRSEIAPLGQIPDPEVSDELNAQKIHIQGVTKGGLLMMVFLGRKHFPSKDTLQYKKFVAHILDKALASTSGHVEEGNGRLVCVVDLEKFSIANIDIRGIMTGLQILQDYYPERLAKLYFWSMPRILVSIWRMISHFLDKATLAKIQMVTTKEERLAMVEEIGEEVLPVEYGGTAKLVPLQDVEIKNLASAN